MHPDLINGLFECFGGFFIFLSILKIIKEKEVKGIHWGTVSFFVSWGWWNMKDVMIDCKCS